MNMFDHYPQPKGYIPHNIFCCPPKKPIVIMPGETTVHSFEIPFNVTDSAKDWSVIYKFGIDII